MAKQLLIENCEISFSRVLPIEEKNKLEESLKISKKANDCLLVKDVVCTILDRKNQNGRTYTTKIMQQAIDEARPQMAAKMLVCSGNEHPVETSSVEPKYISHYISDARIRNVELIVEGKKERHNVLFCDFYVLPTDPHGKNLQRFILEGVGTGISIRGLGDCDANGNVVDYQLLGADIVSNPSSSVYLSTPVTESVSIKPADKLEETFIVSASSTNVTRDLDQAAQLQAEIENKKYGTLAKTSMKVDSEVDPKTGAETTLVTLETETEDETSDLDQALMMAKRAILNGAADIDSVTIENVKEEQPKESVKNDDVPLNEDEVNFDDTERTAKCAWCGDELPLSDLKKEKDLGYVCNHCARGLESREGPLNWEGVYVPESEMPKEQAITEAKEESPNAGKKFVLKCPAGFAAMDGNALVFKASPKEALHFVDGKEETGLVHLSEVEKILDAMGVYDREKYYRKDITDISAKPAEEAVVQNKCENQDVIKEGDNEGMNTSVPAGTQFEAIVKVVGQNGESTDTIPVSATEYDSIIKEVGNLYDMKSQNADGELLITLKEPATGKEYMYNPETRNLDSIENEMPTPLPESAGDVEQNGAKLSMEIDDTDKVEKEFDSPAQASVVKAGLERGKLPGDVMLSEDEQKPDWKIGVVFNHLEYGEGIYNNADPTSGQTVFNGEIPEKVRVYLYPEEFGVTTIDDLIVTDEGIAKVEELAREKLSDKVDATGDIYTVRKFKRDEYPEVPGIFDTEKELIEAERPQYQDAPDYGNQNVQPGWYAGAMNIGVTGPYESEEALHADLGDIADKVQIEYISPEELGLAAESTSMDEVLFNKPSEASDPEVKKPMTDAVEQDITVTVDNVDWNTNDLINTYMNNIQADDVVSFGDIQSKINDLPNELDIKMTKDELPENVNLDTLKELVKNKVAKEYAMNVNDLDIKDLNSIN